MAYLHKKVEALDVVRYRADITITELAERTGIDRRRLGILLAGPSEAEVAAIEAALTNKTT